MSERHYYLPNQASKLGFREVAEKEWLTSKVEPPKSSNQTIQTSTITIKWPFNVMVAGYFVTVYDDKENQILSTYIVPSSFEECSGPITVENVLIGSSIVVYAFTTDEAKIQVEGAELLDSSKDFGCLFIKISEPSHKIYLHT